jgi:cell division septal protein FtsQ
VARTRRKRRHGRLLISLALTALFVLVPAGVYAWGRASSTFDVRHVEVTGAQRVSRTTALRLLQARFLGHNLFSVNQRDVERTLRPLIYLASAQLARRFPSTLVVRLHEYRPGLYALWRGRWYLISDDGHVLAAVGEEKRSAKAALAGGPAHASPRLPAVLASGPLQVRAATGQTLIRQALSVAAALPARLRHELTSIEDRATGLRLHLADGLTVDVGDASQLQAKSVSLQAVLEFYRSKHLTPTYVDVSLPDRPLAQPKLPQG